MNKMSPQAEFLNPVITVMSRAEKLQRWADIVRNTRQRFYIFHLLERYTPQQLQEARCDASAFAAAYKDPILKDAGLKGDSAADAMKFFELSQDELHEFSCNCSGDLSNAEMAKRIEGIAARSAGPAPARGLVNRIMGH